MSPSSRRLTLCSLAVPWEEAVATGQYNVLQARALRDHGWDVQLFKPVPRFPHSVTRRSAAAARWARHPERYELDGIPVYAPKVRFAFVPQVRFGLARISPASLALWFRRAVQPHFDAHLASAKPTALVLHSTMPWGSLRPERPHVFIDRSWRDAVAWSRQPRTRHVIAGYLKRSQGHFTSGRTLQDVFSACFPDQGTEYLPNGVVTPRDDQFRQPRPRHWEGSFVILCVGSYLERKGHRVLVDAVASLARDDPVRLVLVGEPPQELSRLIHERGIADRIDVLPRLPQADLLQYMVWADLFALPSWAEAFGNVYAEAMAAGTPVVLTSESGMAREITHGQHGWIVEPRSVEHLRDALVEALDTDLSAMGSEAQRFVNAAFSWERNAERLTQALDGEGR